MGHPCCRRLFDSHDGGPVRSSEEWQETAKNVIGWSAPDNYASLGVYSSPPTRVCQLVHFRRGQLARPLCVPVGRHKSPGRPRGAGKCPCPQQRGWTACNRRQRQAREKRRQRERCRRQSQAAQKGRSRDGGRAREGKQTCRPSAAGGIRPRPPLLSPDGDRGRGGTGNGVTESPDPPLTRTPQSREVRSSGRARQRTR